MRKLLLSLGLAIVFLATRVVWADVTAFHAVDLLVVVTVALVLLEAGLTKLLLLARPAWAARVGTAPWPAWLNAGLGLLLFGVLTPAVLILRLNQALDASSGAPRTLTINSKWIVTYRGDSHSCRIGVPTDAPWPIVFPWSSDVEPIDVPCAGFAAIVPGRSTVTLAVHSGAIGLPWYGDVHVVP